jgi:hypothetical protein
MVGINMGNLARHNTNYFFINVSQIKIFFSTINTLKNNNSFTLLKDDNIVNTISIVDKFNITIFFFGSEFNITIYDLIIHSLFLDDNNSFTFFLDDSNSFT